MIPKLIHYCWFGKGRMPRLAIRCIESWKRFLPYYGFMLWNEDNFDISSNTYTREAYELKKFAFVTDFVRLHVLFQHGGIYLDTDVEILKNLDPFLELPAFSGFEGGNFVPTGLMASEKEGKWVEEQIRYYDDVHFLKPDGAPDTTTNVHIISESMRKEGFVFDNTVRDFKGIITIFPSEYFCPKSYETGKITLTDNTYCIHHFAESWVPGSIKMKRKIGSLLGEKNVRRFSKLLKRK